MGRARLASACASAAALLLLLSGCAEPALEVPAPAPAALQVRSIAVAGYAYAHTNVLCPPAIVGCTGGSDADLGIVPQGATLSGFRLFANVSHLPGTPAPRLRVEFVCSGAAACTQPLARQEGTGPFVLEGAAQLPGEAALALVATDLEQAPDPVGLLAASVAVQGVLEVAAPPAAPPVLEPVPFRFEGLTGPCIIAVECSSGPSYLEDMGPWGHPVVALHGNLTWSARSDLGRELVVHVRCAPPCTLDRQWRGTSPLAVAARDLAIPPDTVLRLSVMDEQLEAVGSVSREQFVFEGHVLQSVPPPEADHGRRTARDH